MKLLLLINALFHVTSTCATPPREIMGPIFIGHPNSMVLAILIKQDNKFVDAAISEPWHLSSQEFTNIMTLLNQEHETLHTQLPTITLTKKLNLISNSKTFWLKTIDSAKFIQEYATKLLNRDINKIEWHFERLESINTSGMNNKEIRNLINCHHEDLEDIKEKMEEWKDSLEMRERLADLRFKIENKINEWMMLLPNGYDQKVGNYDSGLEENEDYDVDHSIVDEFNVEHEYRNSYSRKGYQKQSRRNSV